MGERESVTAEEKRKILAKIGALAKLLGMIPADDSVILKDPLLENSMELSEWLNNVRNRFHELATLVGRASDLSAAIDLRASQGFVFNSSQFLEQNNSAIR